jgi:hypothetical protein
MQDRKNNNQVFYNFDYAAVPAKRVLSYMDSPIDASRIIINGQGY